MAGCHFSIRLSWLTHLQLSSDGQLWWPTGRLVWFWWCQHSGDIEDDEDDSCFLFSCLSQSRRKEAAMMSLAANREDSETPTISFSSSQNKEAVFWKQELNSDLHHVAVHHHHHLHHRHRNSRPLLSDLHHCTTVELGPSGPAPAEATGLSPDSSSLPGCLSRASVCKCL